MVPAMGVEARAYPEGGRCVLHSKGGARTLKGVVRMLGLLLVTACSCPAAGELSFSDVTAETGMWSVPTAWGVTCADIDKDGDIDLLMANNGSENALFLNEGGLRFRGQPIIGGAAGTEALVPGDVDGDGSLDLLACAWGGPVTLFRGTGDGQFLDATEISGILPIPDGLAGGAALGDIDGDGDPDLYLPDGAKGDRLYTNGEGVFIDVTEAVGLPLIEKSESAVMADFDDDGRLDVYVPRYNEASSLYLNLEGGGLQDLAAATDVFSLPMQVGACPFDVEGDGDLDLLLVRGRFSGEGAPNSLLVNLGDAEFADLTPAAWTEEPGHNQSACAGDVDHDGDLDVLTSAPDGCTLWLNDGTGQFEEALPEALWAQIPGAGAILCDLDDDGDLDILVRARPTGELPVTGEYLFRNELNDRDWLKVRPIDRAGRRFCEGAQVRVYEAGGVGDRDRLVARRDITSACGWGSYHPFVAHFGVDSAKTYDVEARFTDGSRGVVLGVDPGQAVEVAGQ